MSWISSIVRPKIQGVFRKREVPENLWTKCSECGEMIFHADLLAAQRVCPNCQHHMRMSAKERLLATFDRGEYELIELPHVVQDPLKFRDQKRYTDRLRDARTKTGLHDSVLVAHGAIGDVETTVAVQDFAFMGGSLGMAAGEAIVTAAETALKMRTPFVIFTAAGGARMQEGILSLMQMPRTTVAVQMLREAGLPFIVVLTDPTTGGVLASYAMLGDVHIAEPKALIGFTGQRVIEQTIRTKLPEGFQRSEYLLEHGMVDMVVHRHEMKSTLARIIRLMTHRPALPVEPEAAALPAPEDEVAETASTE